MASSLAGGARAPIQGSDHSQSHEAMSASIHGNTPSTERYFVHQQRIKRFSSNASVKSNSEMVTHTAVKRMKICDSTGSSLQSPGAVGSSKDKSSVAFPLRPNVGVFDIGDVVQVDRPNSAPWYGVIRWIGRLGENEVLTAGIEIVRDKFRAQEYTIINFIH